MPCQRAFVGGNGAFSAGQRGFDMVGRGLTCEDVERGQLHQDVVIEFLRRGHGIDRSEAGTGRIETSFLRQLARRLLQIETVRTDEAAPASRGDADDSDVYPLLLQDVLMRLVQNAGERLAGHPVSQQQYLTCLHRIPPVKKPHPKRCGGKAIP